MSAGVKKIKYLVIATMLGALALLGANKLIPLAREHRHNVALGREWAGLLKKHPGFSEKPLGYSADIRFQYAPATDADLRKLRETYALDATAGQGPETDRIIRLTRWVFQLAGHANEPEIPKQLNAFNLIRLATVEHMAINCYMKTVILNEVFLAMGFASRQTHLLPHSNEEEESHFITSVYSPAMGNWLLMDPDCGAYVTDENGTILGVAEVRRRLVAGEPLVVMDLSSGQSAFSDAMATAENFMRGVSYPWFLSDFIFKIRCPQLSAFDQASLPDRVYYELIPDGYREELLQAPGMTQSGKKIIYLNDEQRFWQKPGN
jgi:hypothetical protein